MADRPPFDPLRVAVWLVAFVIASHVVLAWMAMGFCVVFGHEAIIAGKWKCDTDNRMFDLLGSALSAALAFCGGFLAGKKS